jgi:hypothetical protein
MAAPSDAEIAQVAASYSIPPAVLLGIVKQEGGTSTYSLPAATVGAYGLNAAQMRSDPLLALSVVARTLAQSFAQTGSWESALSVYLTGDPNAWESQTSSIGGQVMGILGQASTNPTFGLSGYQPSDVSTFQHGTAAFTQHLQSLVGMGGVVSQHTVDGFRGQAAQIGSQQFQQSANMSQVSEDILTQAKIPVTDANIALITTMARGEGMPLGSFNWLASTQGQGTDFNSVGVKEYPSYQAGINNTAQTLLNGNYDRMIQLMRSGADLTTIARDPGVAQDLRTWQGGSSEDVNNLRALKDVPGSQKPQDKAPDPSKVGEFAQQLQGANIDPHEFAEYFATLASSRRQLLASQRTDVSDYASMQQSLQAAQVPVSHSNILAHVRQQPHPQFPNVTAGAFHDTFGLASLHSTTHLGQFPTLAETASLSGLDNRQISEYYMQKAKQQQAPKAGPAPAAEQDNVVAMPQQKQQKTA